MASTLKDVAAVAGVSIKTVSNVVNGYTFVSEGTRQRVQQIIAELDYVPNVGARNLRRGRTGYVTLAVPELTNPYFAELCGLVLEAADHHQWTVLIDQTNGIREREIAAINAAQRSFVDGVILSPIGLQPADLNDTVTGVPVVLLGERIRDSPIDHVAIDNVRAATTATRHLIDIGRRRIAAVGDQPGQNGTAALRLAGYRGALAACGLEQDEDLVVPASSYHRADGAAAAYRLLDQPRPPDAIFCFNDLLAIGAMRAITDRGLRIPQDIAVMGFDDIDESHYASPRLSSVAPDKAAIAANAITLIQQRLDIGNHTPAAQDVEVPFAVNVRESTAGPAPT